jgi:hypothetical protein
MNLAESLSHLTNKLSQLGNVRITESKSHLDHPEDLVFLEDSAGVRRALQALEDTVKNPNLITIKWDGYPALIFGRNSTGQFSIMDKHMFNKKDGTGRQIFSPEDFREYDVARGVDRASLHELIAKIWPGLEKAVRAKGYYWGDLLFSNSLEEQNGQYKFRANPNGITYVVDADSEIGKLLASKDAAIAVHQFINPSAMSVDEAGSLNGSIGKLKNNTNVAIVPSKMPIAPNLRLDEKLKKTVEAEFEAYGQYVTDMMQSAPQARNSFNQLFTTFVNKKIASGDLKNLFNDFSEYVQSRPMSDAMRAKIIAHLKQHREGLIGAFKIWIALYKLKTSVIKQLEQAAKESPVKGYLNNGTQSHEGFVSQGIKLVDRLGFSRQNFNGKQT